MNEVNPLIWPSPAGIGVMAPDAWQHTRRVLHRRRSDPGEPSGDAYRTDLMESALESLGDLDTNGEAFVKGTVEIMPERRLGGQVRVALGRGRSARRRRATIAA